MLLIKEYYYYCYYWMSKGTVKIKGVTKPWVHRTVYLFLDRYLLTVCQGSNSFLKSHFI